MGRLPALLSVDQPSGERHRRVKSCPDGAKNLGRRRPNGFGQTQVPMVDRHFSERTGDGGGDSDRKCKGEKRTDRFGEKHVFQEFQGLKRGTPVASMSGVSRVTSVN